MIMLWKCNQEHLVLAFKDVLPTVSEDTFSQGHYIRVRLCQKVGTNDKVGHREAFIRAAYYVARRAVFPGEPWLARTTGVEFAETIEARVSDRFSEQVDYWKMRLEGQSHAMAEMLATRSFPGVHGTDSTFMRGTHAQDSTYDDYRYSSASASGVDTNGKRYISGLARYPNDPEAWVGGTGDVQRICKERGWNCRGLVEYEAPQSEPTPDVPIATDIVEDHVAACLRAYPKGDQSPRLTDDIREQVTRELSGEIDISDDNHVSDYEFDEAVRLSES